VARLAALLALFSAMPISWWWAAGNRAYGPRSMDQTGHHWTIWSASRGTVTRTDLVAWPDGVDLLPILGGWLDIFLGMAFHTFLPLLSSMNAVQSLYMIIAAIGVATLARVLGSS